jgi:hypothetical protein
MRRDALRTASQLTRALLTMQKAAEAGERVAC